MVYCTVGADTTWQLQSDVNAYIRCGWKPLGGVAVKRSFFKETFYQAMTKKVKE